MMTPQLHEDSVPLHPERVFAALNRHLPIPCNVIADAGDADALFHTFSAVERRPVAPGDPALLRRAWLCHSGRDRRAFRQSRAARGGPIRGTARSACRQASWKPWRGSRSPAVLVHFNNACFGWIKALQRVVNVKDGKFNDPTFSVDFGTYDMSRLAAVYGIRNWRIETGEQLETALTEALALKEPCFLDVVVESIADRLPPVFSWLKKVGVDPEAVGAQTYF